MKINRWDIAVVEYWQHTFFNTGCKKRNDDGDYGMDSL
jgi:hypothetical protein